MKALKEIKVPLPIGTNKEIRKSVEKAEADLRENMRNIEDSQNEMELSLDAIGAIISADQTNISIASGSWQELTRIALPIGTYIINFGAAFSSNATGTRRVLLARSSGGSSSFTRGAYDFRTAISGANTVCSATLIVVIREAETIYMNGYQDSGAARTAYPWMKAIRIK